MLEDVKKKTLELAKIQETKGEFPWEVKKDHKEQQQLEQAIAASKELEENQPDAYLYVSKRSNKVSKDFTSIEGNSFFGVNRNRMSCVLKFL